MVEQLIRDIVGRTTVARPDCVATSTVAFADRRVKVSSVSERETSELTKQEGEVGERSLVKREDGSKRAPMNRDVSSMADAVFQRYEQIIRPQEERRA